MDKVYSNRVVVSGIKKVMLDVIEVEFTEAEGSGKFSMKIRSDGSQGALFPYGKIFEVRLVEVQA